MSTKMKGLFKGLRYISQVFDEDEKDQDMQIGLPTDVKHVAHVGYDDGPSSSADSHDWMKSNKKDDEKPGVKDSKKGQRTKKSQEKEGEGSKASRRRSTDNANATDTSPKKPSRRLSADNTTAKLRQPRRSQPKDSSEAAGDKKTRRKKSESTEVGARRPKSKSAAGELSDHDDNREDISRQIKEPIQN